MLQQNLQSRCQEPCLTSAIIDVQQVSIWKAAEDDRSMFVSAVLTEWAAVFRT